MTQYYSIHTDDYSDAWNTKEIENYIDVVTTSELLKEKDEFLNNLSEYLHTELRKES